MLNPIYDDYFQKLELEIIPWIIKNIYNSPKKEIYVKIENIKNELGIKKRINNKKFTQNLKNDLFERNIFSQEIAHKEETKGKKSLLKLRIKRPDDVLWNLIPAILKNSVSNNWPDVKKEWKLSCVYEEYGTCVCGHEGIVVKIDIINCINNNILTLGSSCCNKILTGEDLNIANREINIIYSKRYGKNYEPEYQEE